MKDILHNNKQNNKDFIKKVESVWPGVFNFDNLKYNGSQSTVTIECISHGSVTSFAYNFYDGRNDSPPCNGCKIEVRKKKSLDNFTKRLNKKFNRRITFDSNNFIDMKSDVIMYCEFHGDFTKSPNNVLSSKYGCNKCGKKNQFNYHEESKDKTKEQSLSFLKEFFNCNNYFPPYTHLKSLNKSFNTYVKNIKIYESLCSKITSDYKIYMNAIYDLNGRKVDSMYELILNNASIIHNIPHEYQYKFDDTKRTCDYFFKDTITNNVFLEIAGLRGFKNYSNKLNDKIKFYSNLNVDYHEINPLQDSSKWCYKDYFKNHITPFFEKYYPSIKLNDVTYYLTGSNIIETIKEYVDEVGLNKLYFRYVQESNPIIHNNIISVFKNYNSFYEYFNINPHDCGGNLSPGFWNNPNNVAKLIDKFINENGYFPKYCDINFHCSNYHGFGIDDFRCGGKYNHLINWNGKYVYEKLPKEFKFPNNYWTLYRSIEFMVLNIKENVFPSSVRKLRFGSSANNVIIKNGGHHELLPGGHHYDMVKDILIEYNYKPEDIVFKFKLPNGHWTSKENCMKSIKSISVKLNKPINKVSITDIRKEQNGIIRTINSLGGINNFKKWLRMDVIPNVK